MKIDFDAMLKVAESARENAHCPYSHFAVGACVLSDTGELFAGCNVENSAYPSGQCAEATAIGNMVTQLGPRKIKALLILTDTKQPVASCGECLQKISELAAADAQLISYTCSGKKLQHDFKACLPMRYTDEDLHNTKG